MGLLTQPWERTEWRATTTDATNVTALVEAEAPTTRVPIWQPSALRLKTFVAAAWGRVEQRAYQPNWHLDVMCVHLEAVYTQEIKRLLLNAPPRMGKSVLLCVLFPAWCWILDPGLRFLFFSYAQDLAMRDARKTRDLIQSPWYQQQWGDRVTIDPANNRLLRYATTAGGQRVTSSIGGMATGEGGDIVIGDDLHHVSEADSTTRAELDAAAEFWLSAVQTRFNDFTTAREIVAGQRIAVDDVSARVLANQTHVHLSMPMEYVAPDPKAEGPAAPSPYWTDPRTTDGELMFPERFNAEAAAHLKKTLRQKWYAQYQQQPQLASETLFPEEKWGFYTDQPDLDTFEVLVQSWDMRFKEEKDTGSYVAGHLWGRKGTQLYLLDRVCARMSFTETLTAVQTFSAQYPQVHGKLIENKANGPAIVAALRTQVTGLILVEPEGSKYARAQAVAFLQHAGNIVLPHRTLHPWVDEYIQHMSRFPAPPDDDTDASTQAWRRLHRWTPAVDEARQARDRAEAHRRRMVLAAWSQGRTSRTMA